MSEEHAKPVGQTAGERKATLYGAGGLGVDQTRPALEVLQRWVNRTSMTMDYDLNRVRECAEKLIDDPEADPRSKATAGKLLLSLQSKGADVAMHLDDKERPTKVEGDIKIKLYASVEGFDTGKVGE